MFVNNLISEHLTEIPIHLDEIKNVGGKRH